MQIARPLTETPQTDNASISIPQPKWRYEWPIRAGSDDGHAGPAKAALYDKFFPFPPQTEFKLGNRPKNNAFYKDLLINEMLILMIYEDSDKISLCLLRMHPYDGALRLRHLLRNAGMMQAAKLRSRTCRENRQRVPKNKGMHRSTIN